MTYYWNKKLLYRNVRITWSNFCHCQCSATDLCGNATDLWCSATDLWCSATDLWCSATDQWCSATDLCCRGMCCHWRRRASWQPRPWRACGAVSRGVLWAWPWRSPTAPATPPPPPALLSHPLHTHEPPSEGQGQGIYTWVRGLYEYYCERRIFGLKQRPTHFGKKAPFSIAIENVELMDACCPQHLCMETSRIK